MYKCKIIVKVFNKDNYLKLVAAKGKDASATDAIKNTCLDLALEYKELVEFKKDPKEETLLSFGDEFDSMNNALVAEVSYNFITGNHVLFIFYLAHANRIKKYKANFLENGFMIKYENPNIESYEEISEDSISGGFFNTDDFEDFTDKDIT